MLAAIFEPFMPGFSDKVYHQLNMDHGVIPDLFSIDFPAGHQLNAAQPIFRALSSDEMDAFRAKFGSAASASAASDESKTAEGGKKKGGKKKGGKKKGGGGGGKKKGPPAGAPSDVSRIDLRVGQIKRVWNHPDADRLFCEEVRRGVPKWV